MDDESTQTTRPTWAVHIVLSIIVWQIVCW